MARVSVAERTRLSAFVARGMARRLLTRLNGLSLIRLPFLSGAPDRLLIAPQDLRTTDATRAAEIYAGRFSFGGKVVICDARSPFEVTPPSEDWAEALHGFGWLRHLRAADSGITRANARALVDEWITHEGRRQRGGLAAGGDGAPRDVVDHAGAAGAGRFRRAVLPPLHAQPDQAGAAVAAHGAGSARRRAAAAGDDRADVCGALHGQPGAQHQARGQAAERRARPADSSRRRPYQPQSRRADRDSGRPPADAAGVHRPQHAAAGRAAQRRRPHHADAALLPARRRQLRAVQRHGPDALRPARHHPRL